MAHEQWVGGDSARILVLEDDPTLREVIGELLEDEGYRVEVASAGDEALEKVAALEFDLLIFDIRMEGMDGLETLARMLQRGARFPSLAITGFAGDDDPVRALRLGVGDYLRKPFRPDQLLDSVNRLLLRHQADSQLQSSLAGLRELVVWTSQSLGLETAQRDFIKRLDGLSQAVNLLAPQAAELLLTGLVLSQRPQSLQEPSTPQQVRDWVDSMPERFDGTGPQAKSGAEIPLQSQILALARASLEAGDRPQLAEAVRRQDPGRFDPILVGSLDRLDFDFSRADARSWLNLARGLLVQGKGERAAEVLQRILQLPLSQESVEACLTLAELNFPHSETTKQWLRRGVDLARQLGPIAAARAMQWGALLLYKLQAPEAPNALEQARQRLHQLGLVVESALMELALGSPNPEPLELLMKPENEPYLAAELNTLFPQLCRTAPEKLLRRLLLRYPELARRWADNLPASLAHSNLEARPSLRVLSFGGLQVFWGGQPIEESLWRGPFVKYLFAFLARHSHQTPVHESQILDAFWPEGHEKSRRRLSGALSTLRRTLAQATAKTQDPIVRSRDRYSLSPDWEIWHDVHEFEQARRLADDARKGDPQDSLSHLSRMQLLHSGAYLEGCYLDWALLERQRFEGQLVESLTQSATLSLEIDADRSLESAQRAIGLDPYLQPAHLLVMKALLRLRQPEKAIAHYEKLTLSLQRDLSLEPTMELLETYHRARLALP